MFSLLVVAALLVSGVGTALAAQDWNDSSADEVDSVVADVLSQPAYGGQQRGLRDFLFDNPIGRYLVEQWRRFVDWLNSLIPDPGLREADPVQNQSRGRASFGVALLLGIAVVATVVAVRLARKREREELADFSSDPTGSMSSDEMMSAADLAAGQGDHEASVRLRFKAGLLTLDRRGVIDYDETAPLGPIRRAVDQPDFDTVANNFEKVAYSEYEAQPDDTELARSLWRRLLDRLSDAR